jgi:hypothetical protein
MRLDVLAISRSISRAHRWRKRWPYRLPIRVKGGGNPTAVGASFLFHLGDVVYKDDDPSDPEGKDQAAMYNSQFYAQFANYGREIFAIAGNHDGKTSAHAKKSAIFHFLQNFSDSKKKESR